MDTPAPERAAGRRKLAAAGNALPGGTAPIPDVAYLKKAIRAKGRVDPAKWPALKALIRKRARELGAVNAAGVKGTWPFQGANQSWAIELAGPKGYEHGWIKVGDAIERTAHGIETGGVGTSSRADRVATSLRNAARAARTGDHETAVRHLATARADAMGTGRIRVKPVMITGAGSVGQVIDGHVAQISAVRAKADAARSKARRAALRAEAAATLSHHVTDRGSIELVGPKGYIHGWIKVGVPGADHHIADLGHVHTASEQHALARNSGISKKHGTAFTGKQGDTHVVTYNDGSKWISKTLPSKFDADREELAGKISDILGAGAPAVVRDGETRIHEPFVPGDVAASMYRDGMSESEDDAAAARLAKLLDTPEGKRIGLLDTLIGNQDRHVGNWMISPDGKPVPIDHNYSWAVVNRRGGLDTSSPFARTVYGGSGVKPSDFTPAQLDGWQHELEAVKTAGLSPDQRQWFAMTMKAFRDFRAGKGQM